MNDKRRSATIEIGSENAPRRFVIFHGYTGSPDEFQTLADVLSHRLNARVVVPLLPGHGTKEKALLKVTFDDFVNAAKQVVQKESAAGKPIGILGHSFGGYLALLAGADVSPAAIALTVVPYKLRFPFSVPGIRFLAQLRHFWSKELSPKEERERASMFYYPDMPGKAIDLVDEGNAHIKKILPRITCPILTIHNVGDPVSHAEGGPAILAESGGNPLNEHLVFESSTHGLFYGPGATKVVSEIAHFFERAMLSGAQK